MKKTGLTFTLVLLAVCAGGLARVPAELAPHPGQLVGPVVTSVFKKSESTAIGEPIKPPLGMLPAVLPNPPTPAEVAAFAAKRQAQAEYAAAVNAYLAQLGITNGTDTAAIESASAKISKISVVKTNDTGAAGSGIKTIVTEGE